MEKINFKTIILSDIHLGNKNSKNKEVVKFLKNITCEKLILNGDIIDAWSLQRNGKWKKDDTKFFRQILKMSYKNNTEIIYLRGNHDDFIESIAPLMLDNFKIVKEYYYTDLKNKKFYIIHGDVFDVITKNLKWLSILGSIGYDFLLFINKIYNKHRQKRGKGYYSLSKIVKNKIKIAVNYISEYENSLSEYAKNKKCDGIICGHIHEPAIKQYESFIYMNSGDYVENLSCLAEDYEGNWSIIYYNDFFK